MRSTLSLLAIVCLTGCASGKPLGELLPQEKHLREIAGALPGEYRVGIGDFPSPYELTWIRSDRGEKAVPIVGYDHDGGQSLKAATTRGWVDRAAPFEVGVEVVAAADLPKVTTVSVELYALEALDDPQGPAAPSIERIVASQGRLPARLKRALEQPAIARKAVTPGADGKTYKAVFPLDGKGAPWGARWFGFAADYLLSIVIIDEAGGIARTLMQTGPLARTEGR